MSLRSVLLAAYRARTPVILWGPPGVGKTAMIQRLAEELGCELLQPQVRSPEDIALPVVQDGGVRILPVEEFLLASQSERAIVFMDEISTLPPAVQAAALRFLDSGRVGGVRIPESVWRVAAANPPEQAAGGWDLAPPTANRLVHLQVQADAEEFTQHFPVYWGKPPKLEGVAEERWAESRALVASFIHHQPHLLCRIPKEESEQGRAWPSPRTWDYASRALASAPDEDTASVLVAGCVGEGVELQFAQWRRSLDLPSPQEILQNPAVLHRIAERGDRLHAALTALVAHLGPSPSAQVWTRAWEVARVGAEVGRDVTAASLVRHLARTRPAQAPVPAEALAPYTALVREAGMSL